jgi:hypothetical protein
VKYSLWNAAHTICSTINMTIKMKTNYTQTQKPINDQISIVLKTPTTSNHTTCTSSKNSSTAPSPASQSPYSASLQQRLLPRLDITPAAAAPAPAAKRCGCRDSEAAAANLKRHGMAENLSPLAVSPSLRGPGVRVDGEPAPWALAAAGAMAAALAGREASPAH